MVLIHLSDVKQGVAPALHQDFMRTRRQEKTFHPILPKRYSCHSRFQPQTLKQWLTKILKNVKHAFWKCINKNNVKTCDFKMWKKTVKNVLKKKWKMRSEKETHFENALWKKVKKNTLKMHREKSEKCIPSGCGHLGFEPTTGTYVFAFWSCYMQALVWWELHTV